VVAPGTDALGLARRDIARSGNSPRTAEFKAAGAKAAPLALALLQRRMALHAMRNGDQIEALFDLVAHHAFRERFLAARNYILNLRHFVDRIFNLVADGLERAQIGNDGIEVAIGHDVIEARRHNHCHMHAVWPYAGAHDRFDVRVGPGPDAGVLVRSDVWCGHFEWRFIPGQTTRKILAGDCRGRTLRRVTVAAGQNAIDQVIAAL